MRSRFVIVILGLVLMSAWPDFGAAATFTVRNNCGYTIYPGIYPPVYQNGG